MKHSPGGWAEIACELEMEGRWYDAARAWQGAKGASIGHKRRARYEEAADRCIAEADKEWAEFSKARPKT